MIHMKTGGRGSGNTLWLIEQYKITGGKFLIPNHYSTSFLRNYGISPSQYNVNLRAYKVFFMDNFFEQHYLYFTDVITLDERGCDVYLSGTPMQPIPKFFTDYLTQNYPEHMI